MAQMSHPASQTKERSQWVRMRATGSTSTRGSEAEGKTIEALTWLMEVERRRRFLVVENGMTRNAILASTFPGILNATPYLHAGYRCCATCAFAHLYTSFPILSARGSMRQR